MRRLLFTVLIISFAAQPCFASQPKREIKKGNMLYNEAEYDEALEQYEEALVDAPDSDVVNYNVGAALYKTEDYEVSIGHFEKSLVSEDESLEQKANYNIGNAKYKYGIGKEESDLPQAVASLEQSLRHYECAIELDPEDEDAKYNYEFVKEELKRLKKKTEQQETQSQQGEKGESKDQEDQQQTGQEEREEQAGAGEEGEGEEERESQQSASRESPEEISEKEARMILENYSEEDEPKGLYTQKLPKGRPQEVLKDW